MEDKIKEFLKENLQDVESVVLAQAFEDTEYRFSAIYIIAKIGNYRHTDKYFVDVCKVQDRIAVYSLSLTISQPFN